MDVVYARAAGFVTTPDGGRHNVAPGSHWPADDPVVKAQPDLFSRDARFGLTFSVKPAELAEPPVEQATAAPGERRNTRR